MCLNWYYKTYCARVFYTLVIVFLTSKIFAHVDLIDPGLVYENMKTQIEKEEHKLQEQEKREAQEKLNIPKKERVWNSDWDGNV